VPGRAASRISPEKSARTRDLRTEIADPGSMPIAIARSFSACTCHPHTGDAAGRAPWGGCLSLRETGSGGGSRSRSLCAGRLSAGSRVANSVRRRQRSPLERICDSPRWKRRRPTVLGLQSLLVGLRRRVDHRRGQRVQRPEPRGLKPLGDTVGNVVLDYRTVLEAFETAPSVA
jgi:hypothetical protein